MVASSGVPYVVGERLRTRRGSADAAVANEIPPPFGVEMTKQGVVRLRKS